ncbi:MAG TPA: hypothetical protein VHK66_08900, partial [Microvirga sp.]|nr:hypothetical protein [Microvirga sp.]
MSVTLSSGVRKALTSLQSTAAAAQQTQFRLATGKKVNSALDSPASFFTAAGLSNRASDLSRLLDNMGQAVKTLEAADKGIKGITKLVENAQSLAKQAEAATADSVATAAELTTTPVTGAFADNDKITFRVNGTNREVTFLSTDDTLAEFATAITAATDISATVSGSDIKIYTDTATGTAASLSVVSASSAAVLTKLGLTVGAADSGDAAVTRRADLAKEFNALRTQIDQLATDAGY